MSYPQIFKQKRIHKAWAAFVLLFIFSLTQTALWAAPLQEVPLQMLIAQAGKKGLAQTRVWHLLLHYKKDWKGKLLGQEDGSDFYAAAEGKEQPEAELEATLAQFLKPSETLKAGEEHPQCVFPARYKWLKRRLSFDPEILPDQSCPRLEGWLEKLNPKAITLVFSSYYMNNPASMFGHTLLRIDTKSHGSAQNLLNYGVNYAATPDTGNALLYVVKGLIGQFKGEFTIFPYYAKVQTYSNMESRDLWEYELNFSADQMDTFLRHLWELGGNYFDYYYFQENCSYHILSLLEVANPNLHLTDSFFFHVIPSDTIKAITGYEPLVAKKVYRPSLLSRMKHKRQQFSTQEEAVFLQMTQGPEALQDRNFQTLAPLRKALVLDTYLDYAQYQNMKSKKEGNKSLAVNSRPLLLARSKLGLIPRGKRQTEFSTRPELGHGSDRLKLGFGIHEQQAFQEIAYRPAYHDLLARDEGFDPGAQILFLDLTARYYPEVDQLKLDRLQIIDIISLSPYEALFRKKSWHLGFGIDTLRDLDCTFCNSFKASYGLGLSTRSAAPAPLTLYMFIDAEIEISKHLKNGYRAGGGGSLGLFIDPTKNWRIQFSASVLNFPLGQDSDYSRLALNQRYALTQNLDLRLELTRIKQQEEALFSFNHYF